MMRLKHRDAYHTHKNAAMVLFVYTSLCVLTKICQQFGFMYWRFCIQENLSQCRSYVNAEETHKEEHIDCINEYLDNNTVWDSAGSFCNDVFWFVKLYTNETYLFLHTFMIDLPVFWAFFIFDRPHDCFVCLGKDPDRIFSITQYSESERLMLKWR